MQMQVHAYTRRALVAALACTAPFAAHAAPVGVYVYTSVSEYNDLGGTTQLDLCWHGVVPVVPSDSCSGGYSSAYANMNTGTLTAQVTAPSNDIGGGGGGATAQILDFLKFSGTTPGQHVTISMTGGGSDSSANGYAAIEFGLTFGIPSDNAGIPSSDVYGVGTTNTNVGTTGCSNPDGFPGVTLCTTSGAALGVSIDFPVDLVDLARGVYVNFFAICSDTSNGGSCSVADPITLTLPSGVTFSSASGQFLTAPIPASGWLFAGALAALARMRRLLNPASQLGCARTRSGHSCPCP